MTAGTARPLWTLGPPPLADKAKHNFKVNAAFSPARFFHLNGLLEASGHAPEIGKCLAENEGLTWLEHVNVLGRHVALKALGIDLSCEAALVLGSWDMTKLPGWAVNVVREVLRRNGVQVQGIGLPAPEELMNQLPQALPDGNGGQTVPTGDSGPVALCRDEH